MLRNVSCSVVGTETVAVDISVAHTLSVDMTASLDGSIVGIGTVEADIVGAHVVHGTSESCVEVDRVISALGNVHDVHSAVCDVDWHVRTLEDWASDVHVGIVVDKQTSVGSMVRDASWASTLVTCGIFSVHAGDSRFGGAITTSEHPT